jgi:predicted ATPase
MHLRTVTLLHEKFPTEKHYPFNLEVLRKTKEVRFKTPVTFFIGENGSGKSTLLRAISHRCGVHIWHGETRRRFEKNPYEDKLYRAVAVEWIGDPVPGSFFASERFQDFAQLLDEWADETPDILNYFGGKSLMTQSHGQSILAFFKARYEREGIYFMDEPETALSPKSQLELLKLLDRMGRAGHAQFIIATHSPLLLSCPGAVIYDFNKIPIREIAYEETEPYRVYREFFRQMEEKHRAQKGGEQ